MRRWGVTMSAAMLFGAVAGATAQPPRSAPAHVSSRGGLGAINEMVVEPSADFHDVVQLLQEQQFEPASDILNRRIKELKQLHAQRLMANDRQPDLMDCLMLSHYLNIQLGRMDEAAEEATFLIDELQVPKSDILRTRFDQTQQEAKANPAAFGRLLQDMAGTMQREAEERRPLPGSNHVEME